MSDLLNIDPATFADCFYFVPNEKNGLEKPLHLGRALRKLGKVKRVKLDPRMRVGSDDLMLAPVGKPGSQERIAAMRLAVENSQGIFETPE